MVNFEFSLEVVYGLKGLPSFFTYQMSSFSKDLIHQVSALVCIDYTLPFSKPKPQMVQPDKQLHDIAKEQNLVVAPEKIFFVLLNAEYLGRAVGFNKIKTIQSTLSPVHRIPYLTRKIQLMRFVGSLDFFLNVLIKFMIIWILFLI